VAESDRLEDGSLGPLAIQVRKKRFEAYNKAWIQAVDDAAAYRRPTAKARSDEEESDMGMTPASGIDWRSVMQREKMQLDMNTLSAEMATTMRSHALGGLGMYGMMAGHLGHWSTHWGSP
jgi:hypothetical protein